MSDSSLDIDHLARLARIQLSETEKEQLKAELPAIVEFFSTIEQISKGEEIDSQELVESTQLRADELGPSTLQLAQGHPEEGRGAAGLRVNSPAGLTLDELRALAPAFEKDQVVVPPVFGTGESA